MLQSKTYYLTIAHEVSCHKTHNLYTHYRYCIHAGLCQKIPGIQCFLLLIQQHLTGIDLFLLSSLKRSSEIDYYWCRLCPIARMQMNVVFLLLNQL